MDKDSEEQKMEVRRKGVDGGTRGGPLSSVVDETGGRRKRTKWDAISRGPMCVVWSPSLDYFIPSLAPRDDDASIPCELVSALSFRLLRPPRPKLQQTFIHQTVVPARTRTPSSPRVVAANSPDVEHPVRP